MIRKITAEVGSNIAASRAGLTHLLRRLLIELLELRTASRDKNSPQRQAFMQAENLHSEGCTGVAYSTCDYDKTHLLENALGAKSQPRIETNALLLHFLILLVNLRSQRII